MHIYRGNIHMHTRHSDGTGEVEDLIAAARKARLDFIILSDHNILLDQSGEGWRQGILTLIDSEINDDDLQPPGNHCLTLGLRHDVTPHARDPQGLIDAVRDQGGLTFLAHPIDKPGPLSADVYPWQTWNVEGYTGVELWNFMSEFRPYATSKAQALLVGFFPHYFTTGPFPEMLAKWDALLQRRPTPAIGGSDAHALVFRLGPIRRRFLSYLNCFRAVNTYILTRTPLTGDLALDRAQVYEALGHGRAWIGYDRVAPSHGFRFHAEAGDGAVAQMGDQLHGQGPVDLTVRLDRPGHIRLIRAGQGVVAAQQGDRLRFATDRPGAYRVEVWMTRWGKPRGWIFSNAIYLVG